MTCGASTTTLPQLTEVSEAKSRLAYRPSILEAKKVLSASRPSLYLGYQRLAATTHQKRVSRNQGLLSRPQTAFNAYSTPSRLPPVPSLRRRAEQPTSSTTATKACASSSLRQRTAISNATTPTPNRLPRLSDCSGGRTFANRNGNRSAGNLRQSRSLAAFPRTLTCSKSPPNPPNKESTSSPSDRRSHLPFRHVRSTQCLLTALQCQPQRGKSGGNPEARDSPCRQQTFLSDSEQGRSLCTNQKGRKSSSLLPAPPPLEPAGQEGAVVTHVERHLLATIDFTRPEHIQSLDPEKLDLLAVFLQRHQRECEATGRYEEAQDCDAKLVMLKEQQVKIVQEHTRSNYLAQLLDFERRQIFELKHFNFIWEKRQEEFEQKATALEQALQSRHRKALAECKSWLSKQADPRHLRWSRQLQDCRTAEAALVKQKRYREAGKMKLKGDNLLTAEDFAWKEQWRQRSLNRLHRLSESHSQEVDMFNSRLFRARQMHEKKRAAELERLLQPYDNVKSHLASQVHQLTTKSKPYDKPPSKILSMSKSTAYLKKHAECYRKPLSGANSAAVRNLSLPELEPLALPGYYDDPPETVCRHDEWPTTQHPPEIPISHPPSLASPPSPTLQQ